MATFFVKCWKVIIDLSSFCYRWNLVWYLLAHWSGVAIASSLTPELMMINGVQMVW